MLRLRFNEGYKNVYNFDFKSLLNEGYSADEITADLSALFETRDEWVVGWQNPREWGELSGGTDGVRQRLVPRI